MSEEEKVLKIEKGPDIEAEKGEQTEKVENLEQIAEKTKILAAEVTERGNDFREEIKNRKPKEGIIEEFNKREEAIEEEAKNAAKLIINDNNMENKEGLRINQKTNDYNEEGDGDWRKDTEEANAGLDTLEKIQAINEGKDVVLDKNNETDEALRILKRIKDSKKRKEITLDSNNKIEPTKDKSKSEDDGGWRKDIKEADKGLDILQKMQDINKGKEVVLDPNNKTDVAIGLLKRLKENKQKRQKQEQGQEQTNDEKFDKLYDGIIEEVNNIKDSAESSDEKLAKLSSLHEKMSKYINEEGFNEYNKKSKKWREAGNSILKAEAGVVTEKFDKLYDGIIEEVNNIKDSGESSDEKLAKLSSLHEKMSKYINEEGFNEYNKKSKKWRETGNLLYETEKEIEKQRV